MGATMHKVLIRLIADRRGASAIEYGVIVALIALAAMAAIQGAGIGVATFWQNSASAFPTANGS
jgi:pilus assembly protein Flp/PilA